DGYFRAGGHRGLSVGDRCVGDHFLPPRRSHPRCAPRARPAVGSDHRQHSGLRSAPRAARPRRPPRAEQLAAGDLVARCRLLWRWTPQWWTRRRLRFPSLLLSASAFLVALLVLGLP